MLELKTDTGLDTLIALNSLGVRLHPLRGNYGRAPGQVRDPRNQKKPQLNENWREIATTDLNQIAEWYERFPECWWGAILGDVFDQLDIDDPLAWDELAGGDPEPMNTVEVETASGKTHYWLQPLGLGIMTDPFGLGLTEDGKPRVELRGEGSYAVVPPSSGYSFVDGITEIAPMPTWLRDSMAPLVLTPPDSNAITVPAYDVPPLVEMAGVIDELPETYFTNREHWLNIGMALKHTYGDAAFDVWDRWSSKGVDIYEGTEDCQKVWDSIRLDYVGARGGITFRTILFLAQREGLTLPDTGTHANGKPKRPNMDHYRAAISEIEKGADSLFEQSQMTKKVTFGRAGIEDVTTSRLYALIEPAGYSSEPLLKHAINVVAYDRQYHPIHEYLEYCLAVYGQWIEDHPDEDPIQTLADYFVVVDDPGDLFYNVLRQWLQGAIRRVFENGEFNPAMILQGGQGIGKSGFVKWISSGVLQHWYQGRIDPSDKDHILKLASAWVWEVDEASAIIRKADRERLKSFMSQEKVEERRAYGKADVQLWASANFIFTDNNFGLLTDPTGDRRFTGVQLMDIDWRGYIQAVSPEALWGMAFTYYNEGVDWRLDRMAAQEVDLYKDRFRTISILREKIEEGFEIDEFNETWWEPTSTIVGWLQSKGDRRSDQAIGNEVGGYLAGPHVNLERKRRVHNGTKKWGYVGINKKLHSLPDYMQN